MSRVILIARPSMRTSARSVLSRARKDNFCHIAFVPDRAACWFPIRGVLTEKRRGYLIEPYSKCAQDAQRGREKRAVRTATFVQSDATQQELTQNLDQCQCVF